MPSPTTAGTIIEDALGLTNAVGADQTLTADEITDCLRAFNDLIEDWSTQKLAVYGQANQTFSTVAGTGTYTIGTGGTWNTTRPVRINGAYSVIAGASFPCIPMTQEEYNAIPIKTQTMDYPLQFLWVNDFPLGLITLWPVPSAVTPITFSIDRVLTAVTSAGASISFPPGYANAFVYNLAIAVGAIFGKRGRDYPDVVQEARKTLGNIKRANKQPNIMRFDSALTQRWINWRLG